MSMNRDQRVSTVRGRAASPGQWRALPGDVGVVQYVTSGDGYVAFQVLNDGPADILLINESVLPMEALLDNVHTASFIAKLAEWGRVIMFDRRGVGLSDPARGRITLDDWVGDAVAVLDAVGSDRAAVFSSGPSAGLIALQLSAKLPRRVSFLSLYDAVARYRWAEDYPWGVTARADQETDDRLRAEWGTPRLADRHGRFAATAAQHPGFVDWAITWFRRGAAPATAAAHAEVLRVGDVRAALAAITCPTLIINHGDVEDGRYLAEHIANARFVELHNPCHLLFSPELEAVMAITAEMANETPTEPPLRRVLATVLVTDVVDAAAGAAIGNGCRGPQRDHHHEVARRLLECFVGHEVKTHHDGIVATFEGPTSALHCALAICEQAGLRDVTVRVGVHCGEVDATGADIAGLNVQVAQRMCSLAAGSQVLATQRVVDLVDGHDVRFEHLGDHQVKGMRGRLGVFEAMSSPQPLLEVVGARGRDSAQSNAELRLEELSPREREVLQALATGASNAEIAAGLFMSEATVKAHVTHLFVKLDCSNRVRLAIVAHDAGIAAG